MNLYTYCASDPVNYSDPFGLDIWIEGSSGEKGFGLHQSVSVGDRKGHYRSFSLGVEHWYEVLGSMGHVYEDNTLGGPVIDRIHTTPDEDSDALRLLDHLKNTDTGEWEYWLQQMPCREFSQAFFAAWQDPGLRELREQLWEFQRELKELEDALEQAQPLLDWYNLQKEMEGTTAQTQQPDGQKKK